MMNSQNRKYFKIFTLCSLESCQVLHFALCPKTGSLWKMSHLPQTFVHLTSYIQYSNLSAFITADKRLLKKKWRYERRLLQPCYECSHCIVCPSEGTLQLHYWQHIFRTPQIQLCHFIHIFSRITLC